MNEHENYTNPTDQLAFIKSVMDDSQKVLADNGTGFILWGFLIMVAGVASLILEYLNLIYLIGWSYIVCVALGWLYMFTVDKKAHKHNIGNPLTKKIINSIWIAVLLAMTMLGFIGTLTETVDVNHISAVLFTTLGIAYYVQGVITGKSWVRNLGFGWWIGACILYFISGIWAGILTAVMMIGLQIIPGFIFRRQWKVRLTED